MTNMGYVFFSKGDMDMAMEYHLKSKTIQDKLGLKNTAGYSDLMMNMGNVYSDKGKKVEAGKYFRKAYEIYKNLGLKSADDALEKAKQMENEERKCGLRSYSNWIEPFRRESWKRKMPSLKRGSE